MINNKVIENIRAIPGLSLFLNHDLTKFSTLQLESSGDLIVCKTEESVELLMKMFFQSLKKQHLMTIGVGM